MSKCTLQSDFSVIDSKKNIFVIHHDQDHTDRNKFALSPQSQDDSIDSIQTGRWNKREHERFIVGILQHGNEWKKVEEVVKTRSSTQARSHAQKFFIKIKNNKKLSIGQFSTIKKFCEKIKSLDQNNKFQLLQELRDIPFDSEDLPLKKLKAKRKNLKHLKSLKKIKQKVKETILNNDIINQMYCINPIIPNANSNLSGLNQIDVGAMNLSLSQIPKMIPINNLNYDTMNCFTDNPIIYNNNINNLNINFLQHGFLNPQLSNDTNSVLNINTNNRSQINQSTSLPFNGQSMSIYNDYMSLYSSLSSNAESMMNYFNQGFDQYSLLLFKDLCRNYL